jgi:hypothetical protein
MRLVVGLSKGFGPLVMLAGERQYTSAVPGSILTVPFDNGASSFAAGSVGWGWLDMYLVTGCGD